MKTILLCSDLDRTLIPNGAQPESPGVRKIFARLIARQEMSLAYVTGRDAQLVKDAIKHYELPQPDYVIGDVGTTLYRIRDKQWQLDKKWQETIARDWCDCNRDDVVQSLVCIKEMDLKLQESDKQHKYKVSYYTALDLDGENVKQAIAALLLEKKIPATVIWSRDDALCCGLLDILPRQANKLQAIRYLMENDNIPEKNTLFAGDSGNDLDAVSSGLQAILVKNSALDVQKTAIKQLEAKGLIDCLYIAKGGLPGLNGNYAAGVVEGMVHFFPETLSWL